MFVYFNSSYTELQGVIKLSILLSQTAISPCPFHKQIKDPLNIIQSCLGTSLLQKLEMFLLRSIVPISLSLFFFSKVIFLISKVFFSSGASSLLNYL